MKRGTVFLLFILLVTRTVQAQINWGNYSQSFVDGTMDKLPAVGMILAIPKGNNSFWVAKESSRYFTRFKRDSSFNRPKEIIARTTFDTSKVHFFLHGVNRSNARNYQFRITEYPSGKLISRWKGIDGFTSQAVVKSSRLPQMAYLGGYKTGLGKMLVADVKKTDSGQIVATALVAWETIAPVITNVYTSADFDSFLQELQYPWSQVKKAANQNPPSGSLKLPYTNTNLIFLLKADILDRKQVQYELTRNEKVVIPWKDNDYNNSFVWLKDLLPGRYIVKIRYLVQPQNVSSYQFGIEPAWYQTLWLKIIAGVFLAALLGAFLFLMLFIRQKQKTRNEQSNKIKLQLELKAIYAQLNPHFIFNALSSIQGLINKQDVNGANRYLSDFAKLMRESLNNSNKEEISLQQELQMLEIYLGLEQLRFGFEYYINVDENINRYETSLPSLLLQPLVENAVKHGVSALHEAGKISISITKKDAVMVAVITDNGAGFSKNTTTTTTTTTNGFGLKLTRDRIKLLNELNNQQKLTLEISDDKASGTHLTITFNNWFL